MSTNYYWRLPEVILVTGEALREAVQRDNPVVHIGKTYSAGPRGLAFIWAQESAIVRRVCAMQPAFERPVVDEYGNELSGAEFLEILDRVKVNDMAIGEWFS